jgi:hypothetical protein
MCRLVPFPWKPHGNIGRHRMAEIKSSEQCALVGVIMLTTA